MNAWDRPRVSPEHHIIVNRKAKGLVHLLIRPMPCINKFEPPLQALIQPISWAMRLPPASQATRTLTTSVPLTDNCQSEQLHFLVAVWRSAFHSDSCRFVCREGGVRVRRNDETRRVGDGVDAAPGAATAWRGHGSAKSPSGDSSLRRIRGRA